MTSNTENTQQESVAWRRVVVDCEPGFEDIVSTLIFESGFSGIEENSDKESVSYTAYFNTGPDNPDPVTALAESIAGIETGNDHAAARVSAVESVPDEDWEAVWREGLGLVEIGERLVVHPSWIDYNNDGEHVEIVIDPKMAFGTGSHETTRLCLSYLERNSLRDMSVLDVGCGSGVVLISAVKLGARCGIGFDIDEPSVSNAQENLRSNSVHDRVQVYHGDLKKVRPGHFNIIIANLLSGIITGNIRRFHRFVLPGATLLFSGVLVDELKEFKQAVRKGGFDILSTEKLGDWAMLVCTPKTL